MKPLNVHHSIGRLRAAMMAKPCKEHTASCPIPVKGAIKKCQWGHTALEFAEACNKCAAIFILALQYGKTYAQRFHHEKGS